MHLSTTGDSRHLFYAADGVIKLITCDVFGAKLKFQICCVTCYRTVDLETRVIKITYVHVKISESIGTSTKFIIENI